MQVYDKPETRSTLLGGGATTALILMMGVILSHTPRWTWLATIAVLRAANNYAMGIERSLHASAPMFALRAAAVGGAAVLVLVTAHQGTLIAPLAPLAMGYTNYPGGVSSYGVPAENMAVFSPFGRPYFVDAGSGDVNNTGRSPSKAKATVDTAYNLVTASQGDVVVVAAGHVETFTGATGLVPDTAGVTIIGLGSGLERPTFTMNHANANIPVSGASNKLMNLYFVPGTGIDVTIGITVTGADAVLVDIEFYEGAATTQFATGIALSTGAARAKIIRPSFWGHLTGDANVAAISCAVALDRVYIEEPYLYGLFSQGGIYNVTNAMTNLQIVFPGRRGQITNLHATKDDGIAVVATTTGSIISPNISTATNDADGFNKAIEAAAMRVFEPRITNLAGEAGGAWGVASAAA